jgi:site-specific recombinase XerD
MHCIDAIKAFSEWREFRVKKETVVTYYRDLRTFCLFLRNPELNTITLEHVMDYLRGMADLGWDQNSFTVKCMALRKFFEFCRLRGWSAMDESLIPIPPKEYKLPRVATEESYQKILAVIPGNNDPRHIRNKAIIALLWDTGARNSELMALNLSDITPAHRAIIKTEKSRGKRPVREIFWTESTHILLMKWLKKRERLIKVMNYVEPEPVFISICGSVNKASGKRFDKKGVGEMLRRYSNKAGIPTVNAHSFRHHLGRELAKNQVDVMNILGHSSLDSSTIYTMMFGTELEERYRRVKGA